MQMTNQTKQEVHQEEVKEYDAELKNLSGENRRASSSRRSSVRSSEGSRISIGSISSEQNITAFQFMQDRSAIMNSVKDRIRKMQNVKKEKGEKRGKEKDTKNRKKAADTWSVFGPNRVVLGKYWLKRHGEQQQDNSPGKYVDFPYSQVDYLFPGQDHPQRSVECYCCGKPMNSMEYMQIFDRGICIHDACMSNLMKI